jgi:hypothetical protein
LRVARGIAKSIERRAQQVLAALEMSRQYILIRLESD